MPKNKGKVCCIWPFFLFLFLFFEEALPPASSVRVFFPARYSHHASEKSGYGGREGVENETSLLI